MAKRRINAWAHVKKSWALNSAVGKLPVIGELFLSAEMPGTDVIVLPIAAWDIESHPKLVEVTFQPEKVPWALHIVIPVNDILAILETTGSGAPATIGFSH